MRCSLYFTTYFIIIWVAMLGRKYLEWTMRRRRGGKWVRQHIPKEEKQYSIIPVHLFSGADKQCRKVQMWFFRPAT